MKQRPNIFEYLDLKSYLGDVYNYRKTKEASFSYQRWADEMGIRSRAYLRAIVIGEKAAQESLTSSLLKGLQLSEDEAEQFILLLRAETAATPELKQLHTRQLMANWKVKLQQLEVKDSSEFLSDPFLPVLFTYLSFDQNSPNQKKMCEDLQCQPTELQEALRKLIWLKLIDGTVLDSGDISYKTIQPFFRVPSTNASPYLKEFHRKGIQLAEKAAELPSDQRKFYSTFVALNSDEFKQVQDLISDFNQRLLKLFNSTNPDGKKIYRINFQALPVSGEITSSPDLEDRL